MRKSTFFSTMAGIRVPFGVTLREEGLGSPPCKISFCFAFVVLLLSLGFYLGSSVLSGVTFLLGEF